MTPKQADKLIKAGKPVTVRSKHWGDEFTTTFFKHDRWYIYSEHGEFVLQDLEIVNQGQE